MERLTPAWLSDALGVTVTDLSIVPVGTGQVASCLRLSLEYGGPTDLPATMVAKCPADDEQSRGVGIALGHYRAEASFYRDLASGLAIRTPEAFHVWLDEETHDFLLLLEDLAPAEQGDQIVGCDADTAALALAELPKLHAPHWGDGSLARVGVAQPDDPGVGGDDGHAARRPAPRFPRALRRSAGPRGRGAGRPHRPAPHEQRHRRGHPVDHPAR